MSSNKDFWRWSYGDRLPLQGRGSEGLRRSDRVVLARAGADARRGTGDPGGGLHAAASPAPSPTPTSCAASSGICATARSAANGKENPRWQRVMPHARRFAAGAHGEQPPRGRGRSPALGSKPTYLCGQLPRRAGAGPSASGIRGSPPAGDRGDLHQAQGGKRTRTMALTPTERDTVIAVSRAANSAARREIVQIRSFRNILFATALVLAISRWRPGDSSDRANPDLIPLCFHPDDIVLPDDGGAERRPRPRRRPRSTTRSAPRRAAGTCRWSPSSASPRRCSPPR